MNESVRDTFEIAGETWRLADSCDTRDPETMPIPDETAGVYLWLQRAEPGPGGRATDRVLYVGQSKNIANRLLQYTEDAKPYRKEDAVIRSVFDRIIAPTLREQGRGDAVVDAVIDRTSSDLAQMWVRDHVVFAWQPWEKGYRGLTRHGREKELKLELEPMLNWTGSAWTQYERTEHIHHDLTSPIPPRRTPPRSE